MTRLLRYLLVVGGAVISILLFMLASASENSNLFERNYAWLLILNAVVAAALLTLVVLLLIRLYKRYKRGKFGSKLMARLVLLFAMIGILPGAVIYTVSVQFVSRSIESWFDVRVESALESGLNLGRAALDSSLDELRVKARNMALELSDSSDATQITQLSRIRDQNLSQEAVIVTGNGQMVASSGSQLSALLPDLPTAAMLRQARLTRGYAVIEGNTDFQDNSPSVSDAKTNTITTPAANPANSLRLRVVVAIPSPSKSLSLQSESRYLQLLQPVPEQLATNAEALRVAYSEYQERYLARTGLRKIYIVTLTLTLLLAIFGAIAGAFLIASDLAKPLLLLAEGTKAVAEGNLSPRPIVATSDELGTLTQSFNTMTRQLFDARASVEKNRTELENAKGYLESVLANMSAGVMVLDRNFKLVTCNESVERILEHDFAQHIGKPLKEIEGLSTFAQVITQSFSEQSAQSAAGGSGTENLHWQHQIEVPRRMGGPEAENDISLLARGSRLPAARDSGYVVVFDDISDVISAQRSIAWGEVARRLAHEIKNPLTPIQLSAERLHMKLEGKLTGADAQVLERSTATIVNQVTAMKRMVDDFRDYAKTPPAVLSSLDLNSLIEEILHLYLAGDERDIIHANLADGLPHVMGDATQLRQVIHNLLQNAQDAVTDRTNKEAAARIDIITEEIHYRSSDGAVSNAVQLSITDNGPGFSPKILAHAFEPYITSKPRGTGLGLAMVKKIIEEHGGRIDIKNRTTTNGAKVAILLLKLSS
ncbi:sensor histidine kinase [Herminiimonas fonticola]|uniref:histidine kinase n=1 Tax=Herminiimonas fonticola TaxID=303380 RepID=A0A4R6GF99_9BURK|nr:ATP-binding protein [Herminiimonas fonticola]RBA24444.1 Signal transduction histidine kinase involved in nitrogen fixation and metabolism regulation [Herminiimonas fonticola]TDN93561.1 nitrogen fixation/metabolism regulation signal transduction histidine kinase [Herminiimonas fonticola]